MGLMPAQLTCKKWLTDSGHGHQRFEQRMQTDKTIRKAAEQREWGGGEDAAPHR